MFKNEIKGVDNDKNPKSDKIENDKVTTKTTELAVIDEIKQDGTKDKSYVDPDAETDVDTDGETDKNEVTAMTTELAVTNNRKQDSID